MKKYKAGQGIKGERARCYSGCSGGTSLAMKADTGEEAHMESGLSRSESYDDCKGLAFIIFEHLRN